MNQTVQLFFSLSQKNLCIKTTTFPKGIESLYEEELLYEEPIQPIYHQTQ